MQYRSWTVRAGLLGLLVMTLVAGSPDAAEAHDSLIDSSPTAGEVVDAPIDEVTLTFSAGLLDLGGTGAFAVAVSDSDGRYYGDGCVLVNEDQVSSQVALGAPGDYRVQWQVVSTDGHTISDEYSFEYAPPAGTEAAIGSSTPPACDPSGAVAAPSSQTSADGPVVWPWVFAGIAMLVLVGIGVVFMRMITRTRLEQ